MEEKNNIRPDGKAAAVCYAIAAAAFYALNVPCSKLLLDKIAPTYMAAFLYLGAGAGVGIMYLFRHKSENPADRLEKKDMPYTVGMVLLDIIAPILLMLGVKLGTSANASLLGNFEIVATSLIALFIFKEKVSKKLWAAIGLITLSSIILSFGGKGSFTFSVGSLLVLGATACWGLENNCTRSISEKSTYQIVTIKGFGSGAGSLMIAALIGEKLPDMRFILPALLLGFVAYGLSIFTYIRAQKTLGAAKTSAYYAIAPFIGAFLSFVLLREPLTLAYLIALAVMTAGTALVVSDTLKHRI
ncbi:MAG: DMT family transporter [Oscillospiraceae bacterium]|nr:DMT family transporter [Oscillospiraceae bacterium]